MNSIRISALAVVATFVISLAASASASASLPEFVPAGVGQPPVRVVCNSDRNAGALTGPKTLQVVIRFEGCKISQTKTCQNTANPGEIVTNPLAGTLGYIKKAAPTEVGVSLTPEGGGLFVEFECEGVKVKIGEGKAIEGGHEGGNSAIGKISPISMTTSKYVLAYHCVVGRQQVERFEEGPLDVLEAKIGEGPWQQTCLNSKDSLVFAEKVKIKIGEGPPEFAPVGGSFPVALTSTSSESYFEVTPQVAFTSTSTESYFEASGQKVICKSDANTGMLTGSKTVNVTVTFFGCLVVPGRVPCQNTANPGEIVTNPLAGTLGYIKKAAPTEVGVSLMPKGGGLLVEFECGGVKWKVGEGKITEEGGKEGGDSAIGRISPINTKTTNYVLAHHCVEGKQQVERFEEGPLDVLEAKIGEGPWEAACLNSKDSIVFAEKVTVKA